MADLILFFFRDFNRENGFMRRGEVEFCARKLTAVNGRQIVPFGAHKPDVFSFVPSLAVTI